MIDICRKRVLLLDSDIVDAGIKPLRPSRPAAVSVAAWRRPSIPFTCRHIAVNDNLDINDLALAHPRRPIKWFPNR
jgi:hypothetical protein